MPVVNVYEYIEALIVNPQHIALLASWLPKYCQGWSVKSLDGDPAAPI